MKESPQDRNAKLKAKLMAEQQQRRLLEEELAELRQTLADAQEQQERLAREVAYLNRSHQLSVWDPRDHVRLLWWILIRPDLLKEYKALLDDRGLADLHRQASWLASSLLWFPLAVWLIWPWVMGTIPLALAGGVSLLLGIFTGWVVTGLLGANDDPLSALAGVFTTATLMLITVAIVAGISPAREEIGSVLPLGIIVIMGIMTAVAVASIIRLGVTDVVTSVAAVLAVAGVVIIVWEGAAGGLNGLLWIGVAIFMAGFVEERYKDA